MGRLEYSYSYWQHHDQIYGYWKHLQQLTSDACRSGHVLECKFLEYRLKIRLILFV